MEPLALALMLTATACWASAQVIGKLVVRKMDVSVFNAIRPSIVAPMAILFAILTGSLANPGLKFIFAGALAGAIGWFGAVQLYFHLLKRGSAHKIIPIGNSHPLWGVIFAVLFLGEGARSVLFASAIIVIIGAYLLAPRRDKSSRWNVATVPLAFLVAIMWGSMMILSKYCLNGGMTAGTLLVVMTVSAAVSCDITMAITHIKKKIKFNKKYVGLSVLAGTLGFFVGQILSLFALEMEKASVLSPIYGAVIPFGFLLSILLVKERPAKKAILGMIIVFAGVLLATV